MEDGVMEDDVMYYDKDFILLKMKNTCTLKKYFK